MIQVTKLIANKQALPNVRFIDDKIGANIFYVPEIISNKDGFSSLQNFMDNQIKTFYQQITIPGIITNFLGKKLSSQKYYLSVKAAMPNFIYNRVPAKQQNDSKTNIFDMSGIISEILSLTKTRSQKKVFSEFQKLIESVMLDYKEDRKNYLLIDGFSSIDSSHSDLFNLLIYISKLNSSKIKIGLDGIIYKIDNKYYPIAVPKEENLVFLKNHFGTIKLLKDKSISNDSQESLDITKSTIEKISEDASNGNISDAKEAQKQIRIELKKHATLQGTFEEKINQLFKEQEIVKVIDKLSTEVNKKYNGNIKIDIPKVGAFDDQAIVGLDEVGNYNKQKTELAENIDDAIEDLIHGTLENDVDVDIKVLGIKHKIVDDNKNRYKEFQVKIQHKDFGKTTNKPYTVSFRIPVPVNGKYIKIGGNNYVLINQLFPKALQKVAPNMVRFYTHYSTASLSIKSSQLNALNGFKELEEKFIQNMKALKVITTSEIKNADKDRIADEYGLEDLQDFNLSMRIKV